MPSVDLVEILGPGDGGTGDPLAELEFCRLLDTVGMASTIMCVTWSLALSLGVEL